jgi:hypothetical protein
MRNILLAIAFATVGLQGLFATAAVAADTSATVDPIFNYVRDVVVGHPVKIARTVPLVGTDVVADWKNTYGISNLARTAHGFTFDRIAIVTQTNHTPNPDGTTTDTVVDRVTAGHCELRASEAVDAPAGVVFGVCYGIVNSNAAFPATASGGIVDMRLEGGALVMHSLAATPADCFANPATSYRLCTSTAKTTWNVVDGKVQMRVESNDFWIADYDTQALTPRGTVQTYDYKED